MARSNAQVRSRAYWRERIGSGTGSLQGRELEEVLESLWAEIGAEPGEGGTLQQQIDDLTAALAAAEAARVGAAASYPSTTDGDQTLLAANDDENRVVQIVVVVTEEFADGTGAQPVFTLGITGDADSITDGAGLVDAAVGTTLVFAATLDAEDALLVGATAATGNGTGAIDVVVTAQPLS